MVVKQLLLNDFRHFSSCLFEFDDSTNLIVGRNGSGKTSLLEAVYYLAYAKSFRSRSPDGLIAHHKQRFQIDAQVLHPPSSHLVQSSHSMTKGDARLKVDHDTQLRQADLARMLPVVFIDTSTHRDFADTPKNRRDYINWCCFYTQEDYHDHLSKYQRALQHRNQLLKQYKTRGIRPDSQLKTWTEPLLFYANKVHQTRQALFATLNATLATMWPYFFNSPPAQLVYQFGWKAEKDYADCLTQALGQDLIYGYTQHGPHRADIQCLTHDSLPIFQTFSQGQQKLFSYLLRFIQLELVRSTHKMHRILLIDDLPAELDQANQKKIIALMNDTPCQKFVTALTPDLFQDNFSTHAIFVDQQVPEGKLHAPIVFSQNTILPTREPVCPE